MIIYYFIFVLLFPLSTWFYLKYMEKVKTIPVWALAFFVVVSLLPIVNALFTLVMVGCIIVKLLQGRFWYKEINL